MSLQRKSGQLFRIVRFGSGRRTRTSDLRVMSPTSCQLLHPAIYLPCPLPTVFPKPGQHFSKTADLIGLLDRFSTAGLIGTLYRLCVCKDKSKKSFLQIENRTDPRPMKHTAFLSDPYAGKIISMPRPRSPPDRALHPSFRGQWPSCRADRPSRSPRHP